MYISLERDKELPEGGPHLPICSVSLSYEGQVASVAYAFISKAEYEKISLFPAEGSEA